MKTSTVLGLVVIFALGAVAQHDRDVNPNHLFFEQASIKNLAQEQNNPPLVSLTEVSQNTFSDSFHFGASLAILNKYQHSQLTLQNNRQKREILELHQAVATDRSLILPAKEHQKLTISQLSSSHLIASGAGAAALRAPRLSLPALELGKTTLRLGGKFLGVAGIITEAISFKGESSAITPAFVYQNSLAKKNSITYDPNFLELTQKRVLPSLLNPPNEETMMTLSVPLSGAINKAVGERKENTWAETESRSRERNRGKEGLVIVFASIKPNGNNLFGLKANVKNIGTSPVTDYELGIKRMKVGGLGIVPLKHGGGEMKSIPIPPGGTSSFSAEFADFNNPKPSKLCDMIVFVDYYQVANSPRTISTATFPVKNVRC